MIGQASWQAGVPGQRGQGQHSFLGEPVTDVGKLYVGEGVLFHGGADLACGDIVPATVLEKGPVLKLRLPGGREVTCGVGNILRMCSRRQTACVLCARRHWCDNNFGLRRLWDERADSGEQEKGEQEKCWYPHSEAAQRQLLLLLGAEAYHKRHPNIPPEELVRSAVEIPWKWYVDEHPGSRGAPLLLHRRRVPRDWRRRSP